MSDDLNNKIKQIANMLGQENMPDNIKGLLSMLTSSGGKEEPSQKASDVLPSRDEKNNRSELEENIDMVRKIKTIMDKVNTNNDPRVNLLAAIKPFLNSSRQKSLNNCMKLLHMSRLTRLMDENDKG